jgi:hypothetical protein
MTQPLELGVHPPTKASHAAFNPLSQSLGGADQMRHTSLSQDFPGLERAHRFGVLWRKRSQGTRSEKGNRWVERVLSLRHTCRIRGRPTFPMLVNAVSCLFKGERPDLSWLTLHESLSLPSTP